MGRYQDSCTLSALFLILAALLSGCGDDEALPPTKTSVSVPTPAPATTPAPVLISVPMPTPAAAPTPAPDPSMSQPMPRPTPQPMTHAIHQARLQPTPRPTPQPTPQPTIQSTPRPTPQSTPQPAPRPTPTPQSQSRGIQVSGRQLLVDGEPIHLKGVCWNPVGKGKSHPTGLDFAGYVVQDGDLMKSAGINAVRTYEPLTDTTVLDELWERGIYVINSVYPWGGSPANSVIARVQAVKDHPAILMWAVGNEWNYNGLYVNLNYDIARDRVREVVDLIKQTDPTHPVSTVYGEVPSIATLAALSNVDIWGINSYRGISFDTLFDIWKSRSSKPMYLGEFGADAYDARSDSENQAAQAEATTALANELNAQSSVHSDGVTLGGLIFEFADEWWKDGSGSLHVQDTTGIAPGGGPHPDRTFNEEWWGLVDIDRNPRQAYHAYAAIPIPS